MGLPLADYTRPTIYGDSFVLVQYVGDAIFLLLLELQDDLRGGTSDATAVLHGLGRLCGRN